MRERQTINELNTSSTSDSDLLSAVQSVLSNDKAQDVVVLDLSGKTNIADYMVIASGTSKRQIGAMADHLVEKAKSFGMTAAIEGAVTCDWVLIDVGDIIVHLFRPEVRTFYSLERLWGNASMLRERNLPDHRANSLA